MACSLVGKQKFGVVHCYCKGSIDVILVLCDNKALEMVGNELGEFRGSCGYENGEALVL